MNTLFPIEPLYPKGFAYFGDFITPSEEEALMKVIAAIDLQNMQFQGYEAKRRVASFGQDWNFATRRLSEGKPIPKKFHWLIERVCAKLAVNVEDVAELLVTEYPVGSVINWHRDAPPFDLIAGISLGADCIFKLRPYDRAIQTRKAIVSLPVSRCSLYVVQDEARSEWEHSIAPVNQARYSITLRTLRKDGCGK
jgi:alkylated DNA repair dioxygenase AlkB